MAASGFEVNDFPRKTTSTDDNEKIAVAPGFEVSGLSSETIVAMADEGRDHGLSEVAKDPPASNDNETAMMQWNVGAPVPPSVESFPGCNCDWNEPGWTCEGSAVYPRLMAGEKCCCCGIHCKRGRRCTDDQCYSIGVDQGDEVREEERKFAEMLKNADFLIGDDLPAKIVELEKGVACNKVSIIKACKGISMTPICDHTSYVVHNDCYTPGLKGTKFFNRHFSHWSSHRQYFGFDDDVEAQFHGMCFLTSSANALSPNVNSHQWANRAGSAVNPNSKAVAKGLKTVSQADLIACKPKDHGGIGCWRTICVPREPNKAEAVATGSYR